MKISQMFNPGESSLESKSIPFLVESGGRFEAAEKSVSVNLSLAIRFVLAATLFAAGFQNLVAAPGSWLQKADLPAPSSTPVGCVVDGVFYVIGGHYKYWQQLQRVYAYEPRTDSWTRKTDMPTARRWPAGAVVDGIIYVIGGGGSPETPFRTVEAYNPQTDSWTTKADLPTPRGCPVACAMDGIIYVIGGFIDGQGTATARVDAYDPKTDQWTRKKDFPSGNYFMTASAAGGKIYVFLTGDSFAFDPKSDQWQRRASFWPVSEALMSATVDGTIYVFGGFTLDFTAGCDFALAYNPNLDRFERVRKMPRTRAGAACAAIDGKVYLTGGVDKEPIVNPGAIYWQATDIFDPNGGVTSQITSMSIQDSNHLHLVFKGEPKVRYSIEFSPALTPTRWSSIGSTVVATNEYTEASCSFNKLERFRLYRVVEAK